MNANSQVVVDLDERSYPIIIGRNLLGSDPRIVDHVRSSDCLIVSNVTVAPLYADTLQSGLKGKNVSRIELPDGESHKHLRTMERVLDKLVETGANRDTTVIALGGGVIGDIAGFAAASYMRGVRFIQIPTTLLAQVDSSVGGKTGVNHVGGKNLIGAFHQPSAVIIDTDTLQTLPSRELSAGLAEVIKHGAIADIAYIEWLENNMQALLDLDPDALAYAIRRSCEIKAEVVAEDERESGRRAILNFGHTFGHAIENSLGYGEWLHGEAVAAGMVMAAELSQIADSDIRRLKDLLRLAGLPDSPPPIAAAQWMAAMGMDKKVHDKRLRFVLLESLGNAVVSSDFDGELLQALIGGPF